LQFNFYVHLACLPPVAPLRSLLAALPIRHDACAALHAAVHGAPDASGVLRPRGREEKMKSAIYLHCHSLCKAFDIKCPRNAATRHNFDKEVILWDSADDFIHISLSSSFNASILKTRSPPTANFQLPIRPSPSSIAIDNKESQALRRVK